jgi:hypothetical protein
MVLDRFTISSITRKPVALLVCMVLRYTTPSYLLERELYLDKVPDQHAG